MPDPRHLSATDVRAALPMRAAIAAMREAFSALAAGHAVLPVRTAVPIPGGATLLVMPARTENPAAIGAKLVTVFPRNAGSDTPVVQAIVVLIDPKTGSPSATLDGTALTAIRTGAVSGLATDLLARADATRAAIIGSGAQARTQLEAVACVRKLASVAVWSRTQSHAEAFARDLRGAAFTVRVAATAADAARDADIICCATSATDPVLAARDVATGTHVNAIGSFTPAMREFESALLTSAVVVVDQREAALEEAGELIDALGRGLTKLDRLVELGSIVTGAARGRTAPDQITVFKSVGLAIQDVVAGARAVAAHF
jgi:ornithine cyclodeaminase/alanine dehydrogenase-like protein (mu-crystallin family)